MEYAIYCFNLGCETKYNKLYGLWRVRPLHYLNYLNYATRMDRKYFVLANVNLSWIKCERTYNIVNKFGLTY